MNTKSFIFLMFVAMLFSCRKKDDTGYSVFSSKDNGIAQTMYLDIFKAVSEITHDYSAVSSSCIGSFEVDNLDAPSNIDVSYIGGTCEGLSGRVREGELFIQLSGDWSQVGTVIEVTPNAFFVDGYQLLGTVAITNLGINGNGNMEYGFQVLNGQVKSPDSGPVFDWEADFTLEWSFGDISNFLVDDTYLIRGTSSGTNRNGVDFEGDISAPVSSEIVCPWFKTGVFDVVPSGRQVRKLDYGAELCNSTVTIMVEDKSYTVDLP